MIPYQVLQTNIRRIVWQTVRRITNEILGVKGSRVQHWRNRIVIRSEKYVSYDVINDREMQNNACYFVHN